MTKLNLDYKTYVCNAMMYGISYLPLEDFTKDLDTTKRATFKKKLQKAIHRYSKKNYSNDGKSAVTTYQNKFNELVILRKSNFLFPTKNYQPGVIAEVIGQEAPSLQNRAFEYIPSPRKPKPLAYEFKVGDSGTLFCGEPYVVIEKKNDGKLLVNVKNKGRWNIGLRKSDGTCVYDYRNKHLFALLPPVQATLTIPPKPPQTRNFWVNIYNDRVISHGSEEDAKQFVDEKKALAIALPVNVEFTPRI